MRISCQYEAPLSAGLLRLMRYALGVDLTGWLGRSIVAAGCPLSATPCSHIYSEDLWLEHAAMLFSSPLFDNAAPQQLL